MSSNVRTERLMRWSSVPLVIGLALTWVALWREITWMSVISGIIVAVFAMRLFYMPPVSLVRRFNLIWMLRYVGYFFWHLALASVQVAWLCVRPGPPPEAAIIEVKLRTDSDFIITMVGVTASLIPGSIIIEVDRYASTVYLHILNTPTEFEIERAREAALHIEELLIRAIGSQRDVEALS